MTLRMSGLRALQLNINHQNDILPNIYLNITGYNSFQDKFIDSAANGLTAAIAATRDGNNAIIGDAYLAADATLLESIWASTQNVPICSPTTIDDELSDRSLYYTSFRTVPSADIHGRAFALWIHAMGWHRVAVMVANRNVDKFGYTLLPSFLDQASTLGIEVLGTVQEIGDGRFPLGSDFLTPLKAVAATNARIIVGMSSIFPISLAYLWAKKYNMLTSQEYVWITYEGIMNDNVAGVMEVYGYQHIFENVLIPEAGGPINSTYTRS
ncbi:periplasmic binding protein-like I [Polychytrium aggregatum]|uniref:periplasmic binding protein-like I n=1 Tax=Polychytrium aggregatum TaxID=110093 RepID=UPI0022FDD64B|nr:periplasmic binding protein-like I [Polychytrium aggregatum]KAI9190519.1 periplasmic binding protein-like I [Polychytrium aggregatum]